MALPSQFQTALPMLAYLADGQVRNLRDCVEAVGNDLGLSDDEKNELYPNSNRKRFDHRVAWARTILKSAGLIEPVQRGTFSINDLGRDVLNQNPEELNRAFLMRYEGYRNLVLPKEESKPDSYALAFAEVASVDTPQESIEKAYLEVQSGLVSDLLDVIKQCSDKFFERLVVDVLVRMGYGGSREEAGQVVGGPGDGGIDGVIKEDRLGLDVLYVQAKKWNDKVSAPDITQFIGALSLNNAGKGVFITTSDFTGPARESAAKSSSRVILINGIELAEFMIECGVGVETESVYELKRIDPAYFDG